MDLATLPSPFDRLECSEKYLCGRRKEENKKEDDDDDDETSDFTGERERESQVDENGGHSLRLIHSLDHRLFSLKLR